MNGAVSESYTVAIDTCGSAPGVALVRGTRRLGESYLDEERPRGERIAELLSGLLSDAGTAAAEIGGYGVAIGPGSYTGLRIGLALLRGLTLLEATPVLGVGSLDLVILAHELTAGNADTGVLCSVLPAGGGRFYAAVYGPASGEDGSGRGGPEISPLLAKHSYLLAPMLGEPAELLTLIESLERGLGPVAAIGEGAEALVRVQHGDRVRVAESSAKRAGVLALVAAQGLACGMGRLADEVVPMYVGAERARPNRNRVARAAAGLKRVNS